jgi:hypothetical protein
MYKLQAMQFSKNLLRGCFRGSLEHLVDNGCWRDSLKDQLDFVFKGQLIKQTIDD